MKSLVLAMVLLASTAYARTTITSNTDSMGVTHSKIQKDNKETTRCRTTVDSNKVTHTVCDKE